MVVCFILRRSRCLLGVMAVVTVGIVKRRVLGLLGLSLILAEGMLESVDMTLVRVGANGRFLCLARYLKPKLMNLAL